MKECARKSSDAELNKMVLQLHQHEKPFTGMGINKQGLTALTVRCM